MSTLNVEQVNTLGVTVDGNKVSGIPGYNYIINGNFDIWQRGTSQTSSGYGSDDRWMNGNAGSTKTVSRGIFAVGEAFPNGIICPKFYSRTTVASVVGSGNYVNKHNKTENVNALAGKKVAISFWARADADIKLGFSIDQLFGTGGSPSANVYGIGATKVSLTTTWQRFVTVIQLPSVTGKVLGSDGNDCSDLVFWFDDGSVGTRSAALGHQSGTFDIACVSLVEGDKDIKPIPRSVGEELALCQRYYEMGERTAMFSGTITTGSVYYNSTSFKVKKRSIPSIILSNKANAGFATTTGTVTASMDGYTESRVASVTTPQGYFLSIYNADAEL